MSTRSLQIVAAVALLAGVVVFLQGCPRSPCGPLAEGKVYEVELQLLGDGTLYAVEVETTGDDDEDEAEVTAQVTLVDTERGIFEVLGGALSVMIGPQTASQFAIEDLEVGTWVELEGALGQDGVFLAEEVEAAGEHETEIMGLLENLTDTTFTMIGMTIAFDDETAKECEDENEGEDDDDGEEDDDD